jgi:hypothetical protein
MSLAPVDGPGGEASPKTPHRRPGPKKPKLKQHDATPKCVFAWGLFYGSRVSSARPATSKATEGWQEFAMPDWSDEETDNPLYADHRIQGREVGEEQHEGRPPLLRRQQSEKGS